jgi:polysaccharide export outer membrane protein
VTPIPGLDFKQAPKGRTFNASGEYVIAPNDRLSIRVMGSNDIAGDYVVAQGGTVQLPLIGAERAAGLTERDLSKLLTERYKAFLKTPTVAVGVVGYDSYKVFLTGEIRRPGVYTFQEKTSLLQGLATAGGLGEFAKGTIVLYRVGKMGLSERYRCSYEHVLRGQGNLDSFVLERGDVIHVF